jgi:hypothetical protein
MYENRSSSIMSATSQTTDDICGDQTSKNETVDQARGDGVIAESGDGTSTSGLSRIDVVVVDGSDADVAASPCDDDDDASGEPPMPLLPLPPPNVAVTVDIEEDCNVYDECNAAEDDPDNEDEDEDDGLPFPGYVPTAFYYFDQTKQPRRWCLQLITWPYPLITLRLMFLMSTIEHRFQINCFKKA